MRRGARAAGARHAAPDGRGTGGDDPSPPAGGDTAPAPRHFAEVVRLDRLDRPVRGDAPGDLAGRDDVFHPPAVGVADVHVLDEADDVAGSTKAAGPLDDASIVLPPFDDDGDLYRRGACLCPRIRGGRAARGGGVDV